MGCNNTKNAVVDISKPTDLPPMIDDSPPNPENDDAFKKSDLDYDRYLSHKEIMDELIISMETIPEKVISTIIAIADSNKDGKISRKEYDVFHTHL